MNACSQKTPTRSCVRHEHVWHREALGSPTPRSKRSASEDRPAPADRPGGRPGGRRGGVRLLFRGRPRGLFRKRACRNAPEPPRRLRRRRHPRATGERPADRNLPAGASAAASQSTAAERTGTYADRAGARAGDHAQSAERSRVHAHADADADADACTRAADRAINSSPARARTLRSCQPVLRLGRRVFAQRWRHV